MAKLKVLKSDVVNDMINSLEQYAIQRRVSLKDNIPDDVNKLDDLFKDNGEGRQIGRASCRERV